MIDAVVGSATAVGRVRELNEDAILTLPGLFVVADGMGGHAAGEVASALALEQLASLTSQADLKQEDLAAAVGRANKVILAMARARQETVGMGTTVTGVCLGTVGGSPHWFVFNVGDSRVYRFANGTLVQVTVDHSEVEELVSLGRISAADARTHPRRNVVTRSLGSDPAPIPDIWVIPAIPGDCFLICSDGLTTEVEDHDIAAELAREAPAQVSADALVAAAVAAGGRDNVSVIVVRVTGGPAQDIDISTAPRRTLADRS
jgi:serine/threonine protein phosphatase PrpC